MNTRRLLCSVTLAISLATAGDAFAGGAIVDGDGRVLIIRGGACRDLFPGNGACPATSPVLALDRIALDGEVTRFLVGATTDSRREDGASLVFDDSSGIVYLLWQTRISPTTARIRLIPFDQAGFGQLIEVSGQAVPIVGSPRLAITRDDLVERDHAGKEVTVTRRTLHLVWMEREGADLATTRTIYSPVLLENGHYLGWVPRIVLDELVEEDSASAVAGPALALKEPELVLGEDSRSIAIGFYGGALGRLATLEIRLLPGALSTLATEAADYAAEAGEDLARQPGGVEAVAGGVGARIIEMGFGLHVSTRAYLAVEVEQAILNSTLEQDSPGIPLEQLAEIVGARIIEMGSRLFGSDGLERAYAANRLTLFALADQPPATSVPTPLYGDGVRHLLRFYVVSNMPAPQSGPGATFLTSSDGAHGLVYWQAGAEILYRETLQEAWSEVRSLPISSELSLEAIHGLLRDRVNKR